MLTLLSTNCGEITTVLFCLTAAKRETPLAAVIPGVLLTVNTYNEVKGGSALNPVPLPAVAALGDKIVTLYKGGNVVLTDSATPANVIYTFDPVGDLNKAVTFVYDGVKWVLA